MKAFFLLILAVAVSVLLIPIALRLAPYIGLLDVPDDRKVHKKPIPRVGGLGITLGALLPLLIIRSLDPLLLSFVLGSLVIFVFGLWDDARQIGHWSKFTGQLAAVSIVVFYGGLYVTRLPFMDGDVLEGLSGQLFTVFAMTGVINAINHSDGLDGLAAGESILSLVAVAFLGHLASNDLVVDVALAVIGGTLGFLRYNTYPATVFMGDCGSQFMGFALAFLVVYLVQEANPAASAALPLLLFGLPISDILIVLHLRISRGMHLFLASRNHAHHRLLDLGFTHYESVVAIYALQALLVVNAVAFRYASDLVVASLYVVIVAVFFYSISIAERRSWRRRKLPEMNETTNYSGVQRALESSRLKRSPLALVVLIVSLFMLCSTFVVGSVPVDFAVVALIVAIVLCVGIFQRNETGTALIRISVYVTAAFSTYLFLNSGPGVGSFIAHLASLVMVVLALSLGIFIALQTERKFGVTPTDYLILIGLAVLVTFDRIDIRSGSNIQFVTYVILMFYGCEIVIGHLRAWRYLLGWPTLATLAMIAIRGLGVLL
jgi:UDP-GlcNAc:undecaprenyl-phosphate GlcNAc-1-phosphate transferase